MTTGEESTSEKPLVQLTEVAPGVFRTDRGTYVIQGQTFTPGPENLGGFPVGEQGVEIPLGTLGLIGTTPDNPSQPKPDQQG